ncbi:MAG TPA: glycosyltransferase [Candidatus Dormibacteraeota bacterium]|nr:glycosyltransferase [Candidatus Dormibacteraeota bacterium]
MLERILKIFLSNRSPQGRVVRKAIATIKRRRAINFASTSYNAIRAHYYQHFEAKQVEDQTKKVSIVVPCYNTPPKYLEPLLASVFAQTYDNWELVLVDGSDDQKRASYIAEKASHDKRISYFKIQNEGIAGNTNHGLDKATGDLIAFLDHDDTLDPNALAETVEMFLSDDSLGLVYSDEDKLSEDGLRYFQPHFKPDFSLDMLRNVNYITHLVVVTKTVADKAKGIRKGYEGAQDYDFLLRVVDSGIKIGHVPKVLYHWREAENSTASNFSNKQDVTAAGCRALTEHYKRRKIDTLEEVRAIKNRPGFYRAYYKPSESDLEIYINLSSTKLLPIEEDFIIDSYKKNKDVKRHNIKVNKGLPAKRTNKQLVVNGAFIPEKKSTDLISLFMLAQESGVLGVAPKIVRQGRVYDMGIIYIDGTEEALFKDVNPNRYRSFGSLEWVRNVNQLSGMVSVINEGNVNHDGRNIIWVHSIFSALNSLSVSFHGTKRVANYSNPNIIKMVEIFEGSDDYVSDLVKVKE